MSIDDEARTVLIYFDKRYQRTVYGRDGYRERVSPVISIERQFMAAEHRALNIVAEHCPSWPINRREQP